MIHYLQDGFISIGSMVKSDSFKHQKTIVRIQLESSINHPKRSNKVFNELREKQPNIPKEDIGKQESSNEHIHWSKRDPHLASDSISLLIKIYIPFMAISILTYIIALIIVAPLFLFFLPFFVFVIYFPIVLLKSLRTSVYHKELRTIDIQKHN